MAARCATSGRDSTRSEICTVCKSLVPVRVAMMRGRSRTSKMVGTSTHGMRKCRPSPTTSAWMPPRKRCHTTARCPPSTVYRHALAAAPAKPRPEESQARRLSAARAAAAPLIFSGEVGARGQRRLRWRSTRR